MLADVRRFGYDAEGRLASVSEVFAGAGPGGEDVLRTTEIQRDGDGQPTAIVSPDGHVTSLVVGADGYLASVTSPAGQTHEMTYDVGDATGLLGELKRPNAVAAGSNDVYTFTYDDVGRLTRDANPAGGFTELTRAAPDRSGDFSVEKATAEGRLTRFDVTKPAPGELRREITNPAGHVSVREESPGEETSTGRDRDDSGRRRLGREVRRVGPIRAGAAWCR